MSQDTSGGIWAEGWVEEPRALHRSDLYRSLSPEQREVVHALYRLANYKPGRLASGVEVAPGQVARSLRSIAEDAGVSIKVVRTTLRRITAGSDRDAIGPLAGISGGTESGTRTRLITLRHYPRSRLTPDETGTLPGTGSGTQRARSGHEKGTERKKGRREKGTSTLAEGEGSKLADYAGNSAHRDLTARLEATFEEVKGSPYAHSGSRDGKAVADLLRKPGSNVAEIDRRWRRALTLGARWPGCATFAELAAKWNHLADPGARTNAPRPRLDPLEAAAARHDETCPAWAKDLREVKASGDPQRIAAASNHLAPLPARQEGDVLHLTAPDRYEADFLRSVFAPGIAERTGLRVEVSP